MIVYQKTKGDFRADVATNDIEHGYCTGTSHHMLQGPIRAQSTLFDGTIGHHGHSMVRQPRK
jgi:hypothetical protein